MPDRLRARAILAALLILLAIAGTHAVGPAVSWDLPARRVVLVIGIVLEAVFACLLIALRWQGARSSADLGRRLRSMLSGVLATGLIAIPVAILFTSVGRFHRSPPVPPVRLGPGHQHPGSQRGRATTGSADLAIVQEVLIALLIAAIIAAAIVIWRRRRSRLPRLPAPVGAATDTPADLAMAVESGRVALRELDDARAAIIACYVAMELSLAKAGAARAIAETPDELLARAIASGLVDDAPAGRLTALFYEARFSSHPMPPGQRDRAEQALADLAAALPVAEQASR